MYSIIGLLLFLVGVIEMIFVSALTESISQGKVLRSGLFTFINIAIWYFILRLVIDDITDISVLFIYGLGCSFGTMFKVYLTKRRKTMEKMHTLTWCPTCCRWSFSAIIGKRMTKPFDFPIWETEIECEYCKRRDWIPTGLVKDDKLLEGG
jgi:hypothetical protein